MPPRAPKKAQHKPRRNQDRYKRGSKSQIQKGYEASENFTLKERASDGGVANEEEQGKFM